MGQGNPGREYQVGVTSYSVVSVPRIAPTYVCFGSKTEVAPLERHVRSSPENGHRSTVLACPLSAKRRHYGDLFNDRVGHCEDPRWQIEAKLFRRFEIYYELELRYSHHWQISGLLAP